MIKQRALHKIYFTVRNGEIVFYKKSRTIDINVIPFVILQQEPNKVRILEIIRANGKGIAKIYSNGYVEIG